MEVLDGKETGEEGEEDGVGMRGGVAGREGLLELDGGRADFYFWAGLCWPFLGEVAGKPSDLL